MSDQSSGETITRRPVEAQAAEPAPLEHEAPAASMEAGGIDLGEAPATPADEKKLKDPPVADNEVPAWVTAALAAQGGPSATPDEVARAITEKPAATPQAEAPAMVPDDAQTAQGPHTEAAGQETVSTDAPEAKQADPEPAPAPSEPPRLDKGALVATTAPAAAADLSAVRPGEPELPRAATADPLIAALDRTRPAAPAAEPEARPSLEAFAPAPKRRWIGLAAAGVAALMLTGAVVTYLISSGSRAPRPAVAQATAAQTSAPEPAAPLAPVRDVSPVNTAAAETPLPPPASADQLAALEQRVAKLQARLDAIEARGERTVPANAAQVDGRIEKLERDQSRRADELAGRLDRIERSLASASTGTTGAATTAATAPAAAAPAVAAAKPAEPTAPRQEDRIDTAASAPAPQSLAPTSPVPPALPQPRPAQLMASASSGDPLAPGVEARPTDRPRLPGFAVRDVGRGAAVIETADGSMFEVYVGESVPGMGRIESVERRGMTMMVTTSRGIITGMR